VGPAYLVTMSADLILVSFPFVVDPLPDPFYSGAYSGGCYSFSGISLVDVCFCVRDRSSWPCPLSAFCFSFYNFLGVLS